MRRTKTSPGRWLVVLLALLALVPLATVTRAQERKSFVPLYKPREIVVKLANPADLPAVAAQYRLHATPLDQFGTRPIYRLRIRDRAAPPKRAAQLLADPLRRVVYAEPNYIEQTPEGRQRVSWAKGKPTVYTRQWARNMLRLPEAHKITHGAGITVAVLDTGVDRNHPILKPRLVPGYDFVDMDDDPSEVGRYGQDLGYGHGTHVAGLVALAAPAAKIMPVRVLDRHGTGNLWVLAEALAYAVDPDGDPLTDDGAHVINLSISTLRRTNLLADLLQTGLTADDDGDDADDEPDEDLRRAGYYNVVVVAAAGNSGTSRMEYPAAELVPGVLSVAASTAADTIAPFSSNGSWIGVAAPGASILSSVPGGGYGTWSGTSMAAPLAAGTVALVRSHEPGLNAEEVVGRLQETAVKLEAPVQSRIDAAAALNAQTQQTDESE